MVKQLVIPAFLITLWSADLLWSELITIISKLNVLNILEENINQISHHERFGTLNENPVLVVRHFQYRLESIFITIILDGPLGRTNYYEISVEFQVRGSPHFNLFIWVLNSPELTKSNIEEYTNWIDNIIRTELSDPCRELDLSEIVKTYQINWHSKTCHKYKIKSVDFILVNFSQTELSLHYPRQILYQLMRKIRS